MALSYTTTCTKITSSSNHNYHLWNKPIHAIFTYNHEFKAFSLSNIIYLIILSFQIIYKYLKIRF
ncbi:hypothetical protein F383_20841 [Gossypium arboreum]|uniref:Uncharacterized protein n=1 Tax=Gossypium arboreum TaxID=29729 RepID=A0A0B0NRT0_GOSAR|nr:hypothetical protein F383_20841 [Gossypium arboreum]